MKRKLFRLSKSLEEVVIMWKLKESVTVCFLYLVMTLPEAWFMAPKGYARYSFRPKHQLLHPTSNGGMIGL